MERDDFSSDLELILNHLLGRSSEEERHVVEERLMNDPKFKELLEEQRLLRSVVIREERSRVWQKIALAGKNAKGTSRWYWAAAAAAILIAGWFWLLQPANKTFDDFYNPYALDYPLPRGEDERAAMLYDAGVLYRNGDFRGSLAALDSLPPDDDVSFVRGLNRMGLKEYDRALLSFGEIGDGLAQQDARHWYAALCYWALGDRPRALAELEGLRGTPVFPVDDLRKALR